MVFGRGCYVDEKGGYYYGGCFFGDLVDVGNGGGYVCFVVYYVCYVVVDCNLFVGVEYING